MAEPTLCQTVFSILSEFQHSTAKHDLLAEQKERNSSSGHEISLLILSNSLTFVAWMQRSVYSGGESDSVP